VGSAFFAGVHVDVHARIREELHETVRIDSFKA